MIDRENLFARTFCGRTVLITGHTGFKGSWLSLWLSKLGAEVVGVSLGVPTEPSHFVSAGIGEVVKDLRVDLRDAGATDQIVRSVKPDFVFHLAAQALVKESYRDPLTTFTTNVIGTANLLRALTSIEQAVTAIFITSDKCYENLEWVWGYRESDRLGGKDPYSASKASAEMVIRSFVESFLSKGSSQTAVRLAIGRAGNVIGGGDWSPDRLVPDCIQSWAKDREVDIRSPGATRPWQHVLEPLSGYLTLASLLKDDSTLHGEAFNFGPKAESIHEVRAVLDELGRHWSKARWKDVSSGEHEHEAGLLKLNCDKALALLDWKATLEFEETIEATASWYRAFYRKPTDSAQSLSGEQIDSYCATARDRGITWAR